MTPYQTSTYSLGTNAATTTTGTAPANNTVDTSDIATLNDALGSAGVDLRAEEESLQNASHSYHPRSYEDRTRKQPLRGATFNTAHLSATIRSIASSQKIARIPDESVTYLALCLRARLQDLLEDMIKASKHRVDARFDKPARMYEVEDEPSADAGGIAMWSILVRSDVSKQLAALEKIEREEELKIRKERKERADLQAAHAAALSAQANTIAGSAGDGGILDDDDMGGSAPTKKKRKKEGPGVTARNMSEDVRKKMSNAVASQAAGLGGKYAWMTAGGSASAGKAKAAAAAAPTTTTTATPGAGTVATPATPTPPTANANANSSQASAWARPYLPAVRNTSTSNPNTGTSPSGTMTTANGASASTNGVFKTEEQSSYNQNQEQKITVTMRDAMFVIEKERGHGGGKGAARGWV